MSLLTASLLRGLYPEFKDESDETIDAQILFAQQKVWSDKYGLLYDEAVLALAAHELKLNKLIAEGDEFIGKEITSYSAGGQSFSFKESIDDRDNILKSTPYGIKFLDLKEKSITMMPIVI